MKRKVVLVKRITSLSKEEFRKREIRFLVRGKLHEIKQLPLIFFHQIFTHICSVEPEGFVGCLSLGGQKALLLNY